MYHHIDGITVACIFQIWAALAGYGELARVLKPLRTGEIIIFK